MVGDRRSGKLAVILHADVAGSSALVQQDERLAHDRIQETFHRFGDIITQYHGRVRELRGDALLAEFERASDSVTAALALQSDQSKYNAQFNDDIQPSVRVGIAMGEVIIADNTVTGAGVVLAQRVEQLAEPGGVVIQGAAYETIPGRFPFAYADLGEHEVKGFDKPVRAYSASLRSDAEIPEPEPEQADHRFRNTLFALASIAVVAAGVTLLWLKPWEIREEPAFVERMAFPLPDKPSIAVLPFTNMSDDAEQEYFVDGMTDDVITDLSKISGLFVIARNSSFSYKGKSVKVRQVAEDLGVRYVLEGSVRRAADQVRVNVQLIDATTGGHLWAERYDGRYADIFSVQDELTGHIVAALALRLTPLEETRLAHHETDSIPAYDAFLQGWVHYEQRTPDGFAKAVPFFQKAIELDPGYSRAHAALAATYWLSYPTRTGDDDIGLPPGAFGLTNWHVHGPRYFAKKHLQRAMEDPTPIAHRVASLINTSLGQHDEAISEAARAIRIDPNDPTGYFAMNRALTYAGNPVEAIDYIKKAMRLNPHYPPIYLYRLGYAQFHSERFEDAAATLERSISRNPDFTQSLALLAATYGHLNRFVQAKATLEHLADLSVFPLCGWAANFKEKADFNRWCEGLRKARLPE